VSVLVVTGTGTGVGKTVVTAALAALAVAAGRRVAVLKPVQTGVATDEPGDLTEVRRLVGDVGQLTTAELARYPDPLAPATAAARAGRPPVSAAEAAEAAAKLAAEHDLVLVEGAGGLLVRFTLDTASPTPGHRVAGDTLADVAAALAAPVLVVAAAGLGTLNHTALTTEALAARRLRCVGVVIGSWPSRPDLAAGCNLADLPAVTDVPLLGRLPAGAARLCPGEFLVTARTALGAAPGWLG
jgi:dethiobiotin synthetase